MATKLEKAQSDYEQLLRELGTKAEMVGVVERAEPAILKNYRRAEEALGDRKLELEFIQSELESTQGEDTATREELDQALAAAREELKRLDKTLEVKKGKAKPVSTKLAGAEYDLKFVEKSLAEELGRLKKAKEIEDSSKAKAHEENVKRLKIEALKRRKALQDLKNEVRELENPARALEKEKAELEARLGELEDRLEAFKEQAGESMAVELARQLEEKEREVRMAEQHLLDVLADVGEALYEKRISHPVLNKFYADLDVVAEAIDKLQES
jgi:chromosome segregation ATPase